MRIFWWGISATGLISALANLLVGFAKHDAGRIALGNMNLLLAGVTIIILIATKKV